MSSFADSVDTFDNIALTMYLFLQSAAQCRAVFPPALAFLRRETLFTSSGTASSRRIIISGFPSRFDAAQWMAVKIK